MHKSDLKELKPSLCIPICLTLIGLGPYLSIIIFLISYVKDIKVILSAILILPAVILTCLSWENYISAYRNYIEAVKNNE